MKFLVRSLILAAFVGIYVLMTRQGELSGFATGLVFSVTAFVAFILVMGDFNEKQAEATPKDCKPEPEIWDNLVLVDPTVDQLEALWQEHGILPIKTILTMPEQGKSCVCWAHRENDVWKASIGTSPVKVNWENRRRQAKKVLFN